MSTRRARVTNPKPPKQLGQLGQLEGQTDIDDVLAGATEHIAGSMPADHDERAEARRQYLLALEKVSGAWSAETRRWLGPQRGSTDD